MDTLVPEQLSSHRGARLEDVFAVSYRRLVVQLYGVIGDRAEAEDVVQEAFVRAVAAGQRFTTTANPEAWLRTTALNLHRSRWRKLRNFARIKERLAAPQDIPGLDARLDVIDALRSLPMEQREVVALHHLADLSVADIAHELGLPPGTVKSRLSRGREALVRTLSTEEEVDHV
jgi:RNA polymerase sigma-70 factor (ECF subfamily)